MALYEVVLRYSDRDEVRLTDRPLPEGEVVEIEGKTWHVALNREPAEIRATTRYLCQLTEEQRERARTMQESDGAMRVRLERLRTPIGSSSGNEPATMPRSSDDEEREVRAARNQALFRALNERLDELNNASASVTSTFTIACECADMDCAEMIEIDPRDFLEMRREPRQFAVLPVHVLPDVEVVMRDCERYVVVKKIGAAGEVAEATASSEESVS